MTGLSTDELRRFCGDVVRYRHPINRRVIFTPGIRHVVENGAAWLIDDIAILIGSSEFAIAAKQDRRINHMHFWRLIVNLKKRTAVLYAEADCDVAPFFVREISYTDFPLSELSIYAVYDGQFWTLYLPSEH